MLLSCSSDNESNLVLKTEADLSGLSVAVLSGGCYDVEMSSRTDIDLQRYNTLSDALQALLHSNVDVLIHDETALNAYVCR